MAIRNKSSLEEGIDLSSQSVVGQSGIWEIPDSIIDSDIAGGADFYQGSNFAQNFACFAQGIGDFSQGTPPVITGNPR